MSYKLGFVAMAQEHNFDKEKAEQNRQRSLDFLQEIEIEEVVSPQQLIITEKSAREANKLFQNAGIDFLIIQSGTFSSGEAFLQLVKNISDKPILLWAIPEPENEDELTYNSLCGVNLHSSLLSNMNRKYKYYYGGVDDEETKDKIKRDIRVYKLKEDLKDLNIGLLGSRAPGFYTFGLNELNLREKIGPRVSYLNFTDFYDKAEEKMEEQHEDFKQKMSKQIGNFENLSENKIDKYTATYKAFEDIIDEQSLDGIAVRCWPEFIVDYGQAVCATLATLVDNGIITGCEGDVLGTITSYIQNELAESRPFISDLVSIDKEENTGVLWHCGVAPFCLSHSESCPVLGEDFGIGGLNAEFALQPGEVTVARFSQNNGDYRLLVMKGEALDTTNVPRGTGAVVKFENPVQEIMDTIIYEGFEHHLGMVYGDIKSELIELARILDLEVIEF